MVSLLLLLWLLLLLQYDYDYDYDYDYLFKLSRSACGTHRPRTHRRGGVGAAGGEAAHTGRGHNR